MHIHRIFNKIIFIVFLVGIIACSSSDKYDLIEQYFSFACISMEQYNESIEEAETVENLEKILKKYVKSMSKFQSKMNRLFKKHPDLKGWPPSEGISTPIMTANRVDALKNMLGDLVYETKEILRYKNRKFGHHDKVRREQENLLNIINSFRDYY